ncbi:MAG: sulfotransferase [Bacteroidota bacterium]|jgi:hypothetical protein|nr:sulfotransferase [Bacteroidota bacterium]
MTIEEINQLPFVFIVARGRSGTTLMQTLLDANDSVILPIESRLIIHLKQKYEKVNTWSQALIEDFITDLYKDKKFANYWSVTEEQLRKNIAPLPLDEITFPILCKVVYMSYPSPFVKGRIKLLGDKNPIYSIFIRELIEVFPNALFIHLIRDYRDNITSNRKVFKRQSIAQLANGWKAYNTFIENYKREKPSNFYTLRYEDLVSDPNKYVPEICRFLKIEFNPRMLDFHTTIKEVKEEKYAIEIEKIHPNIVNPVNTTQVEKWRKSLTLEEIELADYIAGPDAERYAYKRETNKSGIRFFMKSLIGRSRIYFDFFVIRTYYKMPFFFRDAVGAFNAFLFRQFKISTYYNHADFRFKK